MVITRTTRNRLDGKTSRGFESHHLRHIYSERLFHFQAEIETIALFFISPECEAIVSFYLYNISHIFDSKFIVVDKIFLYSKITVIFILKTLDNFVPNVI